MKRSRIVACALAFCGLVAAFTIVGSGVSNADASLDGRAAHATIRDASGAFLGVVTLRQIRRDTVLVSVTARRLAPGFHGFHVHAVGLCDPTTTDPAGNPSPFLSAGGHFNPSGPPHGHHAGDLPPLLTLQSGRSRAIVETGELTVASLFDADGSAVIVHAGPDNLANIPTRYTSSTTGLPGPDAATLATGDSGGRFGCGVVRRG